MKPAYIVFEVTVVVGNATSVPARKTELHVSDCADPLSLILIINFCPATGVPEGAFIVQAPPKAVWTAISLLSLSIVQLVALGVVATLGVILLLVSVSVVALPT